MRTLEDWQRALREMYAGSGITEMPKAGDPSLPTSSSTQTTPDTGTSGIGVIFGPRREKPQKR